MQLLEEQMLHGGWTDWSGPARIQQDTPIVPAAVALGVWEEASQWLGEELPRAWLVRLLGRAEAVYASNARFRRRLHAEGDNGRDWLWAFTRHWLAALIWQQRRELYARLPASYSAGHALPPKPARRGGVLATTPRPATAARQPALGKG
jgi:hypothetical protein